MIDNQRGILTSNAFSTAHFFALPPAPDEHFKITTIPLWFNIFQQGQIRNFTMGVEFTQNIEEKILRQLLAGVARHRKGIS